MGEHTQALARQNGEAAGALDAVRSGPGFALSFEAMRERVEGLNQFFQGVMQEGTDYGKIPGTDKPTLLQPGAQLLDSIFGLSPTFEEMPSCVRDYEAGFFSFDIRCRLVEKRTGQGAAEGIGHCNSKEDRYRWRSAKRTCPGCGAEAIIKGKPEYGGGWVCFKRQGGCGAKYADDDRAITGQPSGRVENDDTYSLVNTILKMAQKRAHVAATLNATGASRIFTQDVEDLPEFQRRSADPTVVEGEYTERPADPAPKPPQQQARAPEPPRQAPAAGVAPAHLLKAARELYEEARAIGLSPTFPPDTATPIQLTKWAAHWREQIASLNAGDPEDVEAAQVTVEPSPSIEQPEANSAEGIERLFDEPAPDRQRTDEPWTQYQAARAAAEAAGVRTVELRQNVTDGVLRDETAKLHRSVRAKIGAVR